LAVRSIFVIGINRSRKWAEIGGVAMTEVEKYKVLFFHAVVCALMNEDIKPSKELMLGAFESMLEMEEEFDDEHLSLAKLNYDKAEQLYIAKLKELIDKGVS
jgi:hypothetical protein